jgi:hypothetical protein
MGRAPGLMATVFGQALSAEVKRGPIGSFPNPNS